MTIILGLDVSTSVVGVCIVDSTVEPDDKGSHILLLDRIEFKGCKTLMEKANTVEVCFEDICERTPPVGRIVLEDALLGFRPGMSSAQTISTLAKFNGIVGFIAMRVFSEARHRKNSPEKHWMSGSLSDVNWPERGHFIPEGRRIFIGDDIEPEYIGSTHARKLCGIKLIRTAVGGPQKEQVFAHMATNDLKHVKWPFTKSGKVVPWSRDACDAYVVARAAQINGPIQPSAKKPKKVSKPKAVVGGTVKP